MRRRDFVSLAILGAGRIARAAPTARKALFICMDGCDPAYLERSEIPNLKKMMSEGMYRTGHDVLPSVTNVNNASIATATWPSEHGITGNYYYRRETHAGVYMESPEFLLRPTVFEQAKRHGYNTAFISSKNKLLEMLRKGADIAFSAEKPPDEMIRAIGPKADIYSAELNYWAFRAARHLLRQGSTFVYLSTTDYMMHTYPPEAEPSLEHMHQVDKILGAIVDDQPRLEVYFTADHGMNGKPHAVDLGRVLKREKIAAEAVPVIKDRYVAHHGNLGGCCYIYLEQPGDLDRAAKLLESTAGVEKLFTREDAATRFHLKADRIGDLVVFGKKDYAFGDLDHETEETKVRSHGSLHESTVPILCYGHKMNAADYEYNFDLTRRFVW